MGGACQRGQALVPGMLLAGVAALMVLRYFHVDQTLGAQVQQTHALDAATYSAALVNARAFNTMAYINRAQVAHQVAMAHLVTLGSWALFGGAQAQQLMAANPPVHLVGMFFGPAHGAAYAAAARASGLASLAQSNGALAQTYHAHHATVHTVLSKTQFAIAQSLEAATQATLRHVLVQNYPGEKPEDFDISIDQTTLPGYLARQPGQGAFRSFVLDTAGLYRFLDPRNHTAKNAWPVQARCPGLRHELRRRGATKLSASGVWESIDTQSFHALRSNRWIGCYYREYAMGWGWIPTRQVQVFDGPHTTDPPEDFSAQDFWRWVKESGDWDIARGHDNPLANSRAVAGRPNWRAGGLPNYLDVAPGVNNAPVRLAVTLRRPGRNGLIITSRSAADTFYARPVLRADHRHEHANLFRPYWQARLAAHPLQRLPFRLTGQAATGEGLPW